MATSSTRDPPKTRVANAYGSAFAAAPAAARYSPLLTRAAPRQAKPRTHAAPTPNTSGAAPGEPSPYTAKMELNPTKARLATVMPMTAQVAEVFDMAPNTRIKPTREAGSA